MNGRSCGCPWVGIRSSAKGGRPRCIGNSGMALVDDDPCRDAIRAGSRTRVSCQLLRSGRLRSLGRCALAQRGRMGSCGDTPYRDGVISLSTKPSIPLPISQIDTAVPLVQIFGDVWEWTQSHYSPYPGYTAAPGALGRVTASLWPTSLCCAAGRVRPRSRISGPPIGTFSLPMPDGSSWGSGSPERSGGKLYAPKWASGPYDFVQASQELQKPCQRTTARLG